MVIATLHGCKMAKKMRIIFYAFDFFPHYAMNGTLKAVFNQNPVYTDHQIKLTV